MNAPNQPMIVPEPDWIDRFAGKLDEDFARGALDPSDMSWVDRLEPPDSDAAAAALDRPGPERRPSAGAESL